MSYKAALLGAAAFGALSLSANAAAQEAGESIEVITVTAQKREQSLADVPLALTALGEDRLNALGIQQFDELSDFVPGLEVQEQSPNNPGFVIRGITSDSGGAADEARVAVFQDGVSISKSRGSYVELIDMERVEVVKGPQPTLFGRGALIGGINLIQNKASLEGFSASAWAGAGDFNRLEAGGHANMPIGDQFALRAAFIDKSRDGYVENALGGEDFNSVDLSAYRLSARWQPSVDMTFDIIANYQEDTPSGTSFKSNTIPPVPGGSTEPWEPAALNTFGGFEGGRALGLEREVYGVTVLGDVAINEALSLTSISAWRGFESFETFDPDGFAAELLVVGEDAKGKQYSQELRLNYDNGGALTGFVGGSLLIESGSQRIPLATNPRVAQAFFAPVIAGAAGVDIATIEGGLALFGIPNADGFDDLFDPIGIFVPAVLPGFIDPSLAQIVPLPEYYFEETANFGETEAFDLFADATYSLTDRLDLTAGIRWTSEDKSAAVYGWSPQANSPITTLTGPAPTLFLPATPNGVRLESGTREFDDVTYRLAANYEVSDRLNVWANYGRGRRPDVISFDTSQADPFVIVPAEIVDSIETGAFLTLDATTVQASAFYSEYENFQTSRFEPNSATFITDNAGQATQYGLEAVIDHAFTDMIGLYASYAWNFAEFDDTDDQGNEQLLAGNTFRLSPEHAIAFGLDAGFEIGDVGTVRFLPTYSWQSEVFFDNDNDLTDAVQDERQDAYGLLDIKVRFDDASGRYWAEAFAENVLDEDYIIDAGNTGDSFGIPTFIAGAPRMIGVRLGAEF